MMLPKDAASRSRMAKDATKTEEGRRIGKTRARTPSVHSVSSMMLFVFAIPEPTLLSFLLVSVALVILAGRPTIFGST